MVRSTRAAFGGGDDSTRTVALAVWGENPSWHGTSVHAEQKPRLLKLESAQLSDMQELSLATAIHSRRHIAAASGTVTRILEPTRRRPEDNPALWRPTQLDTSPDPLLKAEGCPPVLAPRTLSVHPRSQDPRDS